MEPGAQTSGAENQPASGWDRLQANFQRWIRPLLDRREDQVFLVLTLVIGAVVGLVIVAFIVLTERLGSRMYPGGGEAAWRRLLVPVLGALGTGILLARYFPDARGSGVPQTKAALFAREGFISLRTVLGKFFCSSASLASGIALGREGPSVQIGAGIASVMGRTLGLKPAKVKALLPVGTTAALAAAFNTPIAAVLFSLEEILGDLHAPVLGSVVPSAATSWMVLRLMLGDEPLFHVPQYQLVHPVEFLFYGLLGVLGGIVSASFVKILVGLRGRFLRLPEGNRWLQPAAGGLAVGIAGFFLPEVLGVGYQHVGAALTGHLTLRLMAMLVVLRVLTTSVCYASGNAGGIFGPSLFIGAMLGGSVGTLIHGFFPDYAGNPGAYALVGMGAAFAGIIRVPMTSVIMIFEITHDYSIIVPLMISNLTSFFVSYRLQRQPIYEALAMQEGVHLPCAETRQREGRRPVSLAMRPPSRLLPPELRVAEAWELCQRNPEPAWLVADEGGLLGVVARERIEKVVELGGGEKELRALLERRAFPHVHPDHSLDLTLERMGKARLELLPVVSRANVRKLDGVITLEDVLRAYGFDEPPRPG